LPPASPTLPCKNTRWAKMSHPRARSSRVHSA
jgi:hypothetical protein